MAKKRKKRQLNPSLARGIISILIIALSLIIFLSFFDQAGSGGRILNQDILAPLFGSIRYFIPGFLLLILWFILKEQDTDYKETKGVGIFLMLISLTGLFHLPYESNQMWSQAIAGKGGGILGLSAWPIKSYLSGVAGSILLVALFIISILLTFNAYITHFVLAHQKALEKMGKLGEIIQSSLDSLFAKQKLADTYNQTEETVEDYQQLEENNQTESTRDEKPDFDNKELDNEDKKKTETNNSKKGKSKSNKQQGNKEVEVTESDKELDIDRPDYMKNLIKKEVPPISLLSSKSQKPSSGDIKANVKTINQTMENFDLEVDMGEVQVGPTVTQYTLKPPSGVKLSKITSLSNNLSLALAAHPIRIEAPIPGKSVVGIEVPNQTQAQVTLKELLQDEKFENREHDMMIALGKDVAGNVWFADLPKMPHLLIAGATGSGKTVCINTIIMSLLYQNTPETLRFIMVDPKRVELNHYDGLPHLLTPVITEPDKAVNALEWAVSEMERRFDVLSESDSRNINSHNKKHPDDKLPHIVFIIDELSDLMQAASNEIESATIRLAQMARAVGIHLILATQRPTVDVITGLMKANIPGRIAFSVASATDSRVILDQKGAEKLVGKGDMLLSTSEMSQPKRIQGSFISEQEVNRVIDYLSEEEEDNYDESILESSSKAGSMFDEDQEKDELFGEAKKTVLKADKGSASLLQRKLRIGYARAARILDQLHEEGVVGEARGSKARKITLSEEEIVKELKGDKGSTNVYKSDEEQKDKEQDEDLEEKENEENEEKDQKSSSNPDK